MQIARCPGFDDAALRASGDDQNVKIFIEKLTIKDCRGFSVQGPQQLIQDMGEDRISITVCGVGPPGPSREERMWLSAHREAFSWD